MRKASFPVICLFFNAGWTANVVSVLSWFVVFGDAVLLYINKFGCMLASMEAMAAGIPFISI